jgi:hypothetical protein
MLGSARGRGAAGFIDVYEAAVRLEVTLRLAAGAVRPGGAKDGGAEGAVVVGEEVVAKHTFRLYFLMTVIF